MESPAPDRAVASPAPGTTPKKFTFSIGAEALAEASASLSAEQELRDAFSAPQSPLSLTHLADAASFARRYLPAERAALEAKVAEILSRGVAADLGSVEAAGHALAGQKVALSGDLADLARRHELLGELGVAGVPLPSEEAALAQAGRAIAAEDRLEAARAEIARFEGEAETLRQRFLEEERARSVASISEEHGVMFVHGFSVRDVGEGSALGFSSDVLKGRPEGYDAGRVVVGLRPAVSCSTVARDGSGGQTFYTFGVVVGRGRVLSAYGEDANTEANGTGGRFAPRDGDRRGLVQLDPGKKIAEAVAAPRAASDYNELVVEEPTVTGIFLDARNPEKLRSTLVRAGVNPASADFFQFKRRACELMGVPTVPLFVRDESGIREIRSPDDLDALTPTEDARRALLRGLLREPAAQSA
jgi:hypothetical protein